MRCYHQPEGVDLDDREARRRRRRRGHVSVRMPVELRDELDRVAKEVRWSRNALIHAAIRDALAGPIGR